MHFFKHSLLNFNLKAWICKFISIEKRKEVLIQLTCSYSVYIIALVYYLKNKMGFILFFRGKKKKKKKPDNMKGYIF